MSWRSTWLLMGLAVALFVYIYFVDRRHTPTSLGAEAPKRLLPIKAEEVTNIQLRITNQIVLRAERSTNGGWNLAAPLVYPAQSYAIDALLQALTQLSTPTSISPEELSAHGKTVADFGLDVPQASLTLLHGGRRSEVLFGSKTPAGDQLYLQVLSQPAIYVVNSELLSHIPRQLSDWRDTTLVNLGSLNWDRMEVRQPGRGYSIQLDLTNKFTLTKPIAARADIPKVENLLRKLIFARVQQFISDEPRIDLEPYGLQHPELELALCRGTNDVNVIQFGKSPTNDANAVYARRLSQTNIVLVSKTILDSLQVSANELRDRHLFSFSTNTIDTFEVVGPESFAVRRQFNGLWVVIEPQATLVDSDLMQNTLTSLLQLEGNVEKDVVTDFAPFGLTQPARQYLLKTTITNSVGGVTNRVVAQLDLSAPQNGKVFAKRGDEGLTVYSMPVSDYENLPSAAWQLRDRRVWTFTTNQVVQVTVSQRGVNRTIVRSPGGKWSLAEGSQGIINPAAIEEIMYRLGELRADSWVARGDNNRAQYGFTGDGARLTIELKVADKPYVLNLEVGGATSAQFPFALATVDGQTWIFKFPLKLYVEVLRDVITPLLR